jgi:hypothetical protein
MITEPPAAATFAAIAAEAYATADEFSIFSAGLGK